MAYSVEHDGPETEVVILDPTGDDMDVTVIFTGDQVYITQLNVNTGENDLIMLTASMFDELIKSYDSPEGFHNDEYLRV